MLGITNKDLEKLCRKYFNRDFLGVYPCDVLPNTKKLRISVIFNLSKHDESGSHFIALIKSKTKIIYFDSFGMECKNDYVKRFLKNFNLKIEYNDVKIQDKQSSLCGYFCFYFLYICFFKNKPLSYFIKKFDSTKKCLLINDKKVLSYITNIMKIYMFYLLGSQTCFKNKKIFSSH